MSEWKEEFKAYVESLNLPRDDYRGIIEYIEDAPTVEINEDMIIEYCRKRCLVIMTAEAFADWFMRRRIDEPYE